MISTDPIPYWEISPAGIALIKRFEGLRLHAYRDVVGIWTIGYGDTQNVYPTLQITLAEAEARLRLRLREEFEPAVRKYAQHPATTQHQHDAMSSLAWNIGVGRPSSHPRGPAGFAGSSVARHHRHGEFDAASESFLLWNKAGGRVLDALVKRRVEEARLYRQKP